MSLRLSAAVGALAAAAAFCVPAFAQTSIEPPAQPPAQALPQPAAPPPATAAPRDAPYPGVIRLAVDATDLAHAVFRAHETIPVAGPGPLTLLYPQWLPGNHSPTGPIDKLAGLSVSAGGRPLAWVRDPVDVYAFHLDVPPGVQAVDVDLQFLSPVSAREGRVVMTTEMLRVQWNTVALYPAGYFSRDVLVQASVTVPEGFTAATALQTVAHEGATTFALPEGGAGAGDLRAVSRGGATTLFAPTTFETLVDSPVLAGRWFRSFDLDPGGPARVTLDVVADKPGDLTATAAQLAAHRALVQQAYRLYGSRHYDHYDFLLALSDRLGGIGLEHHRSSEDGVGPGYFTDWDARSADRDLLPHEFTHSWNGKFRRPADLWTPSFNVPMRGSLLWVYEGQTEYWGLVLAARSGLLSKVQARDAIAETAATYEHRVGRSWRPLLDTTNDPVVAMRRPLSWLSWQRSEDYYREGQLIWLDVDTLIRRESGGRRSLDDVARAFFGVDSGSWVAETYTLEDLVGVLNRVQPYDWAGFLKARVEGRGPGAPLDGLTRGGYRLTYADAPTDYSRAADAARHVTDLSFSIGVIVGKDGALADVLWDGPAFKAGLREGVQIIAVNGDAYGPDGLKEAIRAAKGATAPVELLVREGDRFRTVRIDYHDGLRYPRLERLAGVEAPLLDEILEPRR